MGVEVASRGGTDPGTGLTATEAARRLAAGGPNEVEQRAGTPVWRLAVRQLTDTIIVVLLGAAALTAAIGDFADTVVILTVIAMNTTLGVTQEVRADRAITALSSLTAPTARVVRDAVALLIPAREVVEGDLLRLAAGDVVPADARLIRTEGLETDEAALTGESMPATKRAEALHAADTPLADRTGMVHAGTVVTRGRGEAVVTSTASRTALGQIAGLLRDRRAPLTPLQRRLARLGRQLSIAAALLCLLVAVLGVLRGEPADRMLVTAASLAVAAIPESLPAVVSLSLALGAQRMAARGALVRNLPAVETLGSVTVIASDKTGTLTEGTMAVRRLQTPDCEATVSGHGYDPAGEVRRADGEPGPLPAAVIDLLIAGVLCNDAQLLPPGPGLPWRADGDPTEAALLAAATRAGINLDHVRGSFPRIAEVPFDSSRSRMTTVHATLTGRILVVCKGAPESLLDPTVVEDPTQILADTRAAADRYAASGYRVLAVATRTCDSVPTELERKLRVAGLVAFADPLRASALPAVTAAQRAGILPVMITGDHPATAAQVAAQLGILSTSESVVTGQQLAEDRNVRARVYARTAPEQKLDIVTAWQSDGHVVAMTGDGVNDAPALRSADIGVAMGRRGTEVAKQAADLVLTDDDFGTVVAAVAEGRRVYDNIRRFVHYGLSGGVAEILVMLAGPFLGLGVTLLPAQILWINLLTHGLPGVALGVEPAQPDVLTRPPRRPDEGLLAGGIAGRVARLAAILAVASLGVGIWARQSDRPWQSMIFAILALGQLWVALALRADNRYFTANPWLILAVALDAVLVLAGLYWGPLQALLNTQPLTPNDLLIVTLVSLVGAIAVKLEHGIAKTRDRRHVAHQDRRIEQPARASRRPSDG
jgi:P-type Ca2+ transporter type 2C